MGTRLGLANQGRCLGSDHKEEGEWRIHPGGGDGNIQFPRAAVAVIPMTQAPSRKQQGPSILTGFSGVTQMGTLDAKSSFGPLVFQAYFPQLDSHFCDELISFQEILYC